MKIPFLLVLAFPCAVLAAGGSVASYRKLHLEQKFFAEGATFGDLNRDGHADAIAGPYWYAGPDFKERHEFYPAVAFDPLRYSDNFFSYAHDFNGDGWNDILVLGFPGVDASWFLNPGKSGDKWRRNVVFLPVDNESPTFADLFGNGQPVILCMSRGQIGYATCDPKDPVRPWAFTAISPQGPWQRFTHGLGFGDVNGDGRNDILEKDGWWEQPVSLAGKPVWKQHKFAFAAGARGGSQMHVFDVNGDKLPDVITCRDAHGYGLSWFEQARGASGEISFKEHRITPLLKGEKIAGVQLAQMHAIALADFDGDGLPDIVTGKRWWAHGPKGDVEPDAAPVIYAFLLRRGASGQASYEPHLIDDASGIGVQLIVADVNGDQRPDIVSANKRGAFVFVSEKPATRK
ncbi:MAG: VCBS repeat-containing protein [Opitutaceae bacterium]|nr:VCBS repeat-containing protein [Opitutaceae bacterium]